MMGNKTDDYREGFEQGREDSQNPLTQGTSIVGEQLLGWMTSDDYRKGLDDGRSGGDFNPPSEDNDDD